MPAFRTEDWIPLLHHLARAADGVAMKHFGSPALSITRKLDGSPATTADLEIERDIVTLAQTLVPGIGVLGEEYGVQTGCGDTRLIIDPIDATNNFIRGNPVFATLLAVEAGGHLIAGLVSAPALRQRWWASRGNGAFRDGQRLHVSARGRLGESRLYHGTPTASRALARYPGMTALLHDSRSDVEVGDFLQHLRVAEGAAEAAIDLEVEPWDVAALKIIVEEAGGTATGVNGSDRLDAGTLLSTNGRIHRAVLSYFEPAFTDTATYLRAANAASA